MNTGGKSLIVKVDKKGCSYVDIDCSEGYPINIAYDCYHKLKGYLSDRIKDTNEIGGGINSEEVLYKIVTEEGTISIYADWNGVDVRAESIDSNALLLEIYKQVLYNIRLRG